MPEVLWISGRLLLLSGLLFPVCKTDLKSRQIGNRWCIALLVAGVFLALLQPLLKPPANQGLVFSLLSCGGGALAAGLTGVLCRLIAREGFGMGDVKLLPGLGAFLGLDLFLRAMAVTGLVSFMTAVVLLLTRKLTRTDSLPFAPFLALGAVVSQALEYVSL
ncbi:MAG: prepilin peptidase [Clostridia bacterium]|nr:prepilin peptidase [Clostridia bacterium]